MPLTCQLCQQRPATTHVTELAPDGTRHEAHLCQACIREHGFDLSAAPPPLAALAQALPAADADAPAAPEPDATCPGCGLRFPDYAQNNLFGCPACYEAFDRQVLDLVQRHHGADRHGGRGPEDAAPAPRRRTRRRPGRAELERRLAEAVASERFEEAAELRDRLRALPPEAAP